MLVTQRIYGGKFGPPKSKYGRREVPISNELAQALFRACRTGRRSRVLGKAGRAAHSVGPLRAIKVAAKKAGIGEWPGNHTLRHTAATIWFRSGWNAKQVQIALGHHSPAFTLATYVHLLPEDLPSSPFGKVLAKHKGGNKVATQPTETGRNQESEALAEIAV